MGKSFRVLSFEEKKSNVRICCLSGCFIIIEVLKIRDISVYVCVCVCVCVCDVCVCVMCVCDVCTYI